jgi:3-methylcrotonyl-CoA carboxylase alpha subunit
VAAGEALPLSQEQLSIAGHAIEARIYAEDPAQDYIPSVGVLTHLRAPDASESVRIDTGVRAGDAISANYDPMIAKLIVHGADRAEAVRRLTAALTQYEVAGVQTNLRLLRRIASHAQFAAAELDTGFIGRYANTLLAPAPQPSAVVVASAVASLLQTESDDWPDPWAASDSWRMNLEAWQTLILRDTNGDIALQARRLDDTILIQRDGVTEAIVARREGAQVRLQINGASFIATVLPDKARVTVIVQGETYVFEVVDRLSPPASAVAGAGRIVAPIPGRIAAVLVASGATVARGQALVVLEAMKMEITLSAASDGVVAVVRCSVGEMVEEGRELVEVAAA